MLSWSNHVEYEAGLNRSASYQLFQNIALYRDAYNDKVHTVAYVQYLKVFIAPFL